MIYFLLGYVIVSYVGMWLILRNEYKNTTKTLTTSDAIVTIIGLALSPITFVVSTIPLILMRIDLDSIAMKVFRWILWLKN